MSQPHLPIHPRAFIAGAVLFLVILLSAALLILPLRDHDIRGGHDGPATSSNAIQVSQNPSSTAIDRRLVSVLPPIAPALRNSREIIGGQPNRYLLQATPQGVKDHGGGMGVIFQGNRSISTARLQDSARALKGVSRSEFLKELEGKIKEMYHASGFLQASVIVEPDPTNPDNILISIDEGRPYTWGEVKVASETLPSDAIAPLFHVEKGWPASLADMRNMIGAYVNNFQERGYMDCSFTPHISIDDERGQISLQLDIYEGPRYVVHDVRLESPNAQSLFAKLQGQVFSPAIYKSLLAQSGLTTNDIRLEFDASRGEVSIVSYARKP